MYVGGIFCDLAKACNCMNYEILLAKLHFYGIWKVPVDWFRSCLTNIRQKGGGKSPNTLYLQGTVKHGVSNDQFYGPSYS